MPILHTDGSFLNHLHHTPSQFHRSVDAESSESVNLSVVTETEIDLSVTQLVILLLFKNRITGARRVIAFIQLSETANLSVITEIPPLSIQESGSESVS